MKCPLYYTGDIVLYYGRPCIILDHQHSRRGEDLFHEAYRERYIIRYYDGGEPFEHELSLNGVFYQNVNMCAGEYFSLIHKTDYKETEEIFSNLYG